MATVELWTGPMFSGKTTGLLDRVYQFQEAGVPVLLLKHASDTRYDSGTAVTTHSGVSLAAKPAWAVFDLEQALDAAPNTKVVAIDEVQFFSHGITGFVRSARERGVTVLLAGLDRTSTAEYFGQMPWLLAHADVVHKLSSECACGLKAYQTRRKKDAPEGFVGGSERYESVCWGCWYRGVER